MLDLEEMKVESEAAFMEEVVQHRQEALDNVEKFMTDVNEITKEISSKVYD